MLSWNTVYLSKSDRSWYVYEWIDEYASEEKSVMGKINQQSDAVNEYSSYWKSKCVN